jgi:hypothetical protein
MDFTVWNSGDESHKCPACDGTGTTACDMGGGSQKCPACGGTGVMPHPGTEDDRSVEDGPPPAGECPAQDLPNEPQLDGDCNSTGAPSCVVHIDDSSGG